MNGFRLSLILTAVLLVSACSDVVGYESAPAQAPEGDTSRSEIQLSWVDWDEDEPEPGSEETFDFVVQLTNGGEDPFEWPEPCPTFHWSWGESATEYGAGYGYLNCTDLPPLQPDETREFQMKIPAADEPPSAVTLLWELVDPQSCNFMTMTFDGGKASRPGPTADLGCGPAN